MHTIDLSNIKRKKIFTLDKKFAGKNQKGDSISFTNFYMMLNNTPYVGASAEFHYSRVEDFRWEEELIKIKNCGIDIIATYIFWNHIEEIEGQFDFTGRRNLRKFIQLCQKHDLKVIIRVGPFDHGEVRNGGIPDWLYSKPCLIRSIDPLFMHYTKILYTEIAKQCKGLFFKDNGPIIATQLDNEYNHSSAQWEFTVGTSEEWINGGVASDEYIFALKKLALDVGLNPVFFTDTAWGGARAPINEVMPLWGGYAYRPWIFYTHKGKHPATEEYVYQDFHNNNVKCTNDFKPAYKPEERPYLCCEMGGGMVNSYYYRFILPMKSVDAMANIKLGSGCNLLGYYMFQGGNNPKSKLGVYLNENQTPKISYDYQAALGEYGQVRESYRRLKCIHYFINAVSDRLATYQTVLPNGASNISPIDNKTLRYAIRTDLKSGFLFINNFQDHAVMKEKNKEEIKIINSKEEIVFKNISIAKEENAILPFNFSMDGIILKWASAQLLTIINGTYVFFAPDGMEGAFVFEKNAIVSISKGRGFTPEKIPVEFEVKKGDKIAKVLLINRELANNAYIVSNKGLLFTDQEAVISKDCIKINSLKNETNIYSYPSNLFKNTSLKLIKENILGQYLLKTEKNEIKVSYKENNFGRYILNIDKSNIDKVKDVRLGIYYQGDIGHAFLNDNMISDNFSNDDVWEIGLKGYLVNLKTHDINIYITPKLSGAKVNVESAMAARNITIKKQVAQIDKILARPLYEFKIK